MSLASPVNRSDFVDDLNATLRLKGSGRAVLPRDPGLFILARELLAYVKDVGERGFRESGLPCGFRVVDLQPENARTS
jgi:hypothetical protein